MMKLFNDMLKVYNRGLNSKMLLLGKNSLDACSSYATGNIKISVKKRVWKFSDIINTG